MIKKFLMSKDGSLSLDILHEKGTILEIPKNDYSNKIEDFLVFEKETDRIIERAMIKMKILFYD